MAAISARRMSRADRDRKRPTASPETSRLSQAQGEGHNAAWRCATCDSSSRTSQRPSAWIVKVVRIVRVMAWFARAEAEVAEVEAWRLKPGGWPGLTPAGCSRSTPPITQVLEDRANCGVCGTSYPTQPYEATTVPAKAPTGNWLHASLTATAGAFLQYEKRHLGT
ncbi:hypothetical protein EJ02DRAFT_107842 [Clathrospora elynae]|uniref:Uncharacterized protein n=1 Tax=Clathrospora elynae TaxID=706981 RepID=A0A6A5S5M9_9PLEO|nr:hypothetical protein EJ02DRAFT_107842 [Clathrospora elynae]